MVREGRQPVVAGIADMYFLWHSELKPPVLLMNLREVQIYIQLMRTTVGQTPRWCKIEDDYFEGANI